jgi:hypothetical protein
MDTPQTLETIRLALCALGDHIREVTCTARDADGHGKLNTVASVTAADTIYHIDRLTEEAIADWFDDHWPASLPVEVVMEGAEETGSLVFPRGLGVAQTVWKCLLDPIDGTRNMMYDKRSAWALAGVAPQRGPATSLGDVVVAAMTELPTSKAWRSDQLSAIRGTRPHAFGIDVRTGERQPIPVRPSSASDCRHAFATVTRFFPDGLGLLGTLEERLWEALHPEARGGSPLVFNDQYLTTGGQLYELMVGHDRFTADLRPLVFRKLGLESSLAAHPYDLSAVLVAEQAGILVEDPLSGRPLAAPLDTTTPVAWAGYANPAIAARIRPVLKNLIQELLT